MNPAMWVPPRGFAPWWSVMSSTAGSPGWEDLALLAATVSLVVAGAVFPAGRAENTISVA